MPKNRLNIVLRKDGRYQLQKSVDGKMKSFYGKSKFEVRSKYNQFIHEKENLSRETGELRDCIYEWLINFKFGKIKDSSYDRLESVYLHHIKNDEIGKMQVHEVKSVDVQKFIDGKAFPEDKKDLLSISSLKKIKELLSGYFRFAFEQNIIIFNPMLAVNLPLNENMEKKTKEVEELPQNVIEALYDDCNMSRRYNIAFVILLNTGLRIGELIALKWSDIDLANNIIHTNKTISINKKRDGTKAVCGRIRKSGSTKTSNGNRFIPINKTVKMCLEKINIENEAKGIVTDYVISTGRGTVASARNIQRAFDGWLSSKKIKHYNLHALRHTFGSILIRNGVDVKVVSELLGHANVQTTYNIYIHIIKEQKAKAVSILDEIN